ncbi:SDR family oxidoreductase, partial [Nostoc sp. NIES-2111]
QKVLPQHLVNNARDASNLRGSGARPSASQWDGEFRLGVQLPCDLTLELAGLAGSPLKSVVNIASMYGVVATQATLYERNEDRAPLHYGVVKAALIHLTRELAVRLGPTVRVNAVSYGGVEGRVDDAIRERYARLTPLARMLSDADLAGPVDFLTSDGATAVTGHNLLAEGGWTAW